MARATTEGFRIDLDLDHARREAERVRDMLRALRRRHDLSRFEYTRVVRIVPGGDTFSHPMLTLGNRFAENEDTLLSTYLHEQMHWYLWHLGTPERDPVAPFFDELVRRYPEAPTELPDGARNYKSTYLHLVINWLEVAATAEFIGRHRAVAVAEVQRTYRWIYRTVLQGLGPAAGALRAARPGADPQRRGPDRRERQGRQTRPQRRSAKNCRSSAPARTSSIPP